MYSSTPWYKPHMRSARLCAACAPQIVPLHHACREASGIMSSTLGDSNTPGNQKGIIDVDNRGQGTRSVLFE